MGTEIAAKRVINGVSRSAAADFEQEVTMLNQLHHPCILNFFGVTENTAGDMFMVGCCVCVCGGGGGGGLEEDQTKIKK
jgi:hypothetical protein